MEQICTQPLDFLASDAMGEKNAYFQKISFIKSLKKQRLPLQHQPVFQHKLSIPFIDSWINIYDKKFIDPTLSVFIAGGCPMT